jgi:UDP-N-acetylmuramate dehydrogenase
VTFVPSLPTLAEHTTLQVGGAPDAWVVADTETELIEAVTACDRDGIPVLLLGGGSNMLVADEGFRGTVVEICTRGVALEQTTGEVTLDVAAGEPWDALVDRCVSEGWSGVEALSGIPGLVGATPVQNVGAYGQDMSQTVAVVRALDRRTGQVVAMSAADCGFGYRHSAFKSDPDRWVVLSVGFRLATTGVGQVRYAELARALQVEVDGTCDVADIRAHVLALRRAKGMVLDEADPDTRSVGSFFVNPIVTDEVSATIPGACPRYPSTEGVKLSAAWLIENSGITRGFRLAPDAKASVSAKHTLALTNQSGASARDVIDLARVICERVEDSFGVTLRPEARLVNCAI